MPSAKARVGELSWCVLATIAKVLFVSHRHVYQILSNLISNH